MDFWTKDKLSIVSPNPKGFAARLILASETNFRTGGRIAEDLFTRFDGPT
jgi:hypothetical protein